MKKLPRRRKHLGVILSDYALSKNGQHLLYRPFKIANSNIITFELHSTHGKANNQAFYKAKTRTSSKKRYEMCQVK